MKKMTILILGLATLVSCSNSEKYEKISGNWECITWINKSNGIDKCNNNVLFNFHPDKNYSSKLGSAQDSGSYKILNGLLYVSPIGKLEFAVKIIKLNNDTLELLMNQAGDEEILTMKKTY